MAGLVCAALAYQLALVAIPTVLMRVIVGRAVKAGSFNAMLAVPQATAASRSIPRPSPDLAYSICPYDVSTGPVVVEVPAMPAPYWSLSVFDARTDTAFVRNNQQAGNGAIRMAIMARGATPPPGYEAVTVDGARGVAVVRVLVTDSNTFPAIDSARRAASCRTWTVAEKKT